MYVDKEEMYEWKI